ELLAVNGEQVLADSDRARLVGRRGVARERRRAERYHLCDAQATRPLVLFAVEVESEPTRSDLRRAEGRRDAEVRGGKLRDHQSHQSANLFGRARSGDVRQESVVYGLPVGPVKVRVVEVVAHVLPALLEN